MSDPKVPPAKGPAAKTFKLRLPRTSPIFLSLLVLRSADAIRALNLAARPRPGALKERPAV
eukprot:7934282-Pyramimonas_sp.AAC.1